MSESVQEMTDYVFDLAGELMPAGYVFALWQELVRILPWLATEEQAGILPMRGTERGNSTLLSRRSKLVIRMPKARADQVQQLSGQLLDIAGNKVRMGEVRQRSLQSHPTLHSYLVTSSGEESEFLSGAEELLRDLGVDGNLICGKRVAWKDGQASVSGYSLVIHALKAEDSLRLQQTGLGGERRFGCGIFVPYKVISGLD